MADNLYVLEADLKATLDLTGTTYADDDVTRAIEAASRAVETLTGRLRFYLPDLSNDETRYYTPTRPLVLEIDDAASITSVASDQDDDGVYETTWTPDTDYKAGPPNAALNGYPYEELRILSRARYSLPLGTVDGVQVIGQFGWSAAPSQVQTAAFIIAEKLVRRMREAPFGIVGMGLDGAAVRIGQTDPDVNLALLDFDRRPFAV